MPSSAIYTTRRMAACAVAAIILSPAANAQTDYRPVLETYSDIALAKYEDSLAAAKALDEAADALIAEPSKETMEAARSAWKTSRIPYQQTEAYRFGNPIVDDWEGRVNAWPLDEGLIDYVDAGYGTESDDNALYTANVIANPAIEIGGSAVDASEITPDFLAATLQEAGGVELDEMHRTFNMGIGMVFSVEPDMVEIVMNQLSLMGEHPVALGDLAPA